jgi:hypothetical protein
MTGASAVIGLVWWPFAMGDGCLQPGGQDALGWSLGCNGLYDDA